MVIPGPPTFLVALFPSAFWPSSAVLCSLFSVPMAKGTLVVARWSPATLWTLIPSHPFLATCPFPQLTHFLLRHFSSSKPSNSREFKPLLFLNPVLGHYTYLKPATLWERMKSEWRSSPRTWQSGGQPDGGRGLLLKAPTAFTPLAALTKLFPSHSRQLQGGQAEEQPPPVFVPVFLEVGVGTGGLHVLCWFWHHFHMVPPQECSLKGCILNLAPVLAPFLLLHSQVISAFYSKHLSGVPRGCGLCWFTSRAQKRRSWLKVCWKDDNMNK